MKRPLINLDWVAFSVTLCRTDEDSNDTGFVFRNRPNCRLIELGGNNIYKRRIILYTTDGEKILTILCDPYSHIIAHDSALVEVANKWLYGGSLNWVMSVVYDLHPCCFLCLSRVDICGDFQADMDEWAIIQGLADNSMYVQSIREGSMFHDYVDNPEDNTRGRVPKCLSWGSKRSNIKWKLYNKSLELTEYDDKGRAFFTKPYIVDQWRENDMDVNRVWRLEISISPLAKFQWRGRVPTMREICDRYFVEDLFSSQYASRFRIRMNQGHADRTNDKRVELLDVFATTPIKQKPTQNERSTIEYISGLRSAVKQLSLPEVQASDIMFSTWLSTAKKIVEVGHLEAYFMKTFGFKYQELGDKMISEREIL